MTTRYLPLGHGGLRVAELGLGTMTFGTGDWHAGDDASRAIFRRYLERGGNFIDTADVYGGGAAEELVGRLIRETGDRDRLVVATKFGGPTHPDDPNARGNGRKHILAAVEASLRRLGTDYIDLYWLHLWDRTTDADEVMATFDALVRAGKIRAAGLSNVPAWWAAKAQMLVRSRGWEPVAALQLEYSLIERTLEWEHGPAAQNLGMTIVPWSPLANGFLTGKYRRRQTAAPGAAAGDIGTEGGGTRDSGTEGGGTRDSGAGDRGAGRLAPEKRWPVAVSWTERHWRVLGTVTAIAGEVGWTPAQVALAWVVRRPGVGGTLVGATGVAQLDAALDALELDLSADQLARLDAVSRPDPVMTPHSLFARFAEPDDARRTRARQPEIPDRPAAADGGQVS